MFSDPGDDSARPMRFRALGALPLPVAQQLADDAIAAFSSILGPRFRVRLAAEHRSFWANEFAEVVRANGFARPSASVRALLCDHLREDDPEPSQSQGGAGVKWPVRGALPGWGSAELARLRAAVVGA